MSNGGGWSYNDDDDEDTETSHASRSWSRPHGPIFGLDPLHYFIFVYSSLLLWVLFLLVPRGIRFQYCGSYAKRHQWSARSSTGIIMGGPGRSPIYYSGPGVLIGSRSSTTSSTGGAAIASVSPLVVAGGGSASLATGGASGVATTGAAGGLRGRTSSGGTTSSVGAGAGSGPWGVRRPLSPGGYSFAGQQQQQHYSHPGLYRRGSGGGHDAGMYMESGSAVGAGGAPVGSPHSFVGGTNTASSVLSSAAGALPARPPSTLSQQQQQQEEMVLMSAAMQMLRDPGLLVVAHGSRGKPKRVRLQLTDVAITWRTETMKKHATQPKLGKLHQVPLVNIMFVEMGKNTTALRRLENASVPENLCFSLLTKEGSLDLEATSVQERDALVNCFAMVLDEIHHSATAAAAANAAIAANYPYSNWRGGAGALPTSPQGGGGTGGGSGRLRSAYSSGDPSSSFSLDPFGTGPLPPTPPQAGSVSAVLAGGVAAVDSVFANTTGTTTTEGDRTISLEDTIPEEDESSGAPPSPQTQQRQHSSSQQQQQQQYPPAASSSSTGGRI